MKTPTFAFLTALALLAFVGTTQAADKKKPKKDDSASLFEALGDMGSGSSGLGDLKQATDGVGPNDQKTRDQGLSLKKKNISGDGKVKVTKVFAAPRISHKKGQCVPKPNRVKFFTAPDFPFDAERFSVCALMEGGAGRAMRMSVRVTTGKGKTIGSAESIADFSGKTRLQHAIDFPPLEFPEAGVYRYIIEIEGDRVANLPLFEVRPENEEIPE